MVKSKHLAYLLHVVSPQQSAVTDAEQLALAKHASLISIEAGKL